MYEICNSYIHQSQTIGLHETTELRKLVRQSNQVENVVTRILINYPETANSSTVSPRIQTVVKYVVSG